tara:strand:- start:206 stop:733 length:528 start_codon:yes stop_codon:yes gene_type:complete
MRDIKKLLDLTPILFLVGLSILTNFIGDTLSYKIQDIFTNNIMLKHIIIVLLMYSSLSVIDVTISPLDKIKKSIVLWILFIFFVKNTLRITGLIILLLLAQFILIDYINYNKNNINNKESIDKLNILNSFLEYSIIVLIVIGHIIYINKQKNIFKSDFNYYDLYLSNTRHLKTSQ